MFFKLIKQLDAMDCGPACLAMIAKHYGKKHSIERLREQSFLGREGVSLLGISKAAEQIGFRSVGGRLTIEHLIKQVPLPCIVHWDQNHFVVLYKVTMKRKNKLFYVADPDKGLINYNEQEFCNHWVSTQSNGEAKGIALILEPSHLFYDLEGDALQSGSRLAFLWKYLTKYKRYFRQLILGLFIGSVLQLIFPFLTQSIVDVGIHGKDVAFIWLVLIAQLMLLVSRTAVDFIRRKILLHISTRINISLISDFFIKLMKLPMAFFDTKLTGDLIQRIEDHSRIERFLTTQTLNLLFSLFNFLVFGAVLFYYDGLIFTIFTVGSLIYVFWIQVFLKKRRVLDYKLFEHQAINRNVVYQMITGMQEIKLQGCEQKKRWEWEDVQADLFDVNLQSLSLKQTQEAGSMLINELKNILITVVAATAVIHGQLTLGMMLAVQYIIGQLNGPIEQIMAFVFQWQDVSISLDRMNEIHMQSNEENKDKHLVELNNKEGVSAQNKSVAAIRLKDLCFKYDGSRPDYVLSGVNLTIPQGKVTAIVGASGSGKTTLVKLLLGYYAPNEGTIFVGKDDLENFNLSWWRSECGSVMQEGYLFSDTIANNIAISDETPNLEKIRYAAKVANIDTHIEKLPLGYNTKIGQDGEGLSQGQRQRILIARVVYKNPQFVFLDEATNALDANNERNIVENLNLFYRDKTVIVVAHRLSTVKHADQIVVLDQGRIAEVGNHEALTLKRGKYYALVKNQLELGK